ncbi:Cytosolic carboxypeptidase 1 [Aphelenchoides besseyi]|nr:Cytosolic carboxypeptidase 1 [Aphelenchoides besseyi]
MLAAALNNLSSLVNGDHKVKHLSELFQALIDLCLNQSKVEDQNELAREIDKLFNSSTAKTPALYDFLSIRKKKPVKKKAKEGRRKVNSISNNSNSSASTTSPRDSKKQSKRSTKTVGRKSGTQKAPTTSRANNRRRLVSADSTTPVSRRRLSSSTISTSCTNVSANVAVASPTSSTSSNSIDSSNDTVSFANVVNTSTPSGSKSMSFLSSGESAKDTTENRILQLVKAIELSSDEMATMVLCRLLEGYVAVGTKGSKRRRLRQMVQLDAANFLLRSIRAHLSDSNPTPFAVMTTEILITTTVRVCVKDNKLQLKVRLLGLLQLLAMRILEVDRIHCTQVLLQFTCKTLKSPRNSQLMGRDRQFAERFTNVLVAFNAIECADSVPFVPRTTNPDAYSGPDKMARLIEILFYVTKNRKNKSYLLDQGIIGVLKNIFENHFERRAYDLVHSEIAIITVAVIRHLCKSRKGKDEMANLKILEMCESSITQLSDDKVKFASKQALLSNCNQLQDSLCALCIRCLPQLPFPVPIEAFPLTFPIPPEVSRSKNNSLSKPPIKSTLRKGKSLDNNDSAIDEADSDDDAGDEEEDSFMSFSNAGGKLLGGTDENETMDELMNSDDEEDRGLTGHGVRDASFALPKYTRQKFQELKERYVHMFYEHDQGANPPNALSPKLRRTNTGPIATSPPPNSTVESTHRDRITYNCQQTKSVGEFVKIAYPELADPNIETERRDLLQNQESMRETVVQKLTKARLQSQNLKSRVVFDLDQLHVNAKEGRTVRQSGTLSNNDFERCGRFVTGADHLCFESRFESGNLRKAIQLTDTHYELVLSPDINEASPHFQWFYFEVSNNQPNVSYTFEIINCLKTTSMFSKGMQPVMFSVTEAKSGRPGWVRAGSSVCYYRNLYVPNANGDDNEKKVNGTRRRTQSIGPSPANALPPKTTASVKSVTSGSESKPYFSIRFTIRFRHAADVCYIAYHYPYTFSYLRATLELILARCQPKTANMYVRSDRLTQTLGGNPVDLLTITANGTVEEVSERPFVLFMARVHPGESNASWIMHGILNALTADTEVASRLRRRFIFKIVPCLNPDGVINGSHRCSLAGIDLNRVWDSPSSTRNPTVYHAKGIVQYMTEVLKKPPFCIVDLHGHSRKSNVFTYGNNPEQSWRPADFSLTHSGQAVVLPELLDKLDPGFSLKDCRYSITKAKEPSARITLWRQFGVERCYTMESTYSGFDAGVHSGKQIGIADLKLMGKHLCESVSAAHDWSESVAVKSSTKDL